MSRRIFVGVALLMWSQIARATIWTNTRPEIAQMARLWEVDTIQISPLLNAQYPNIGGGTSSWEYTFASTSASSDGDLHHAVAINSSGTGQTGNNIGNSPGIGEIVNSSAYISTITAISAANNHHFVPRGIFRVYTEHANEIHYEVHPMTEVLTNSAGAWVVAANVRSSITNDAYARHGYAISTLRQLVDGSIMMSGSVMAADNNRVILYYPTGAGAATMNYPEYDGRVVQTLTNDFCSSYFTFIPTNAASPPGGAITNARVIRCRIVTNTLAASIAAGLVSNMAVNVNALNRIDMLSMSNTIASLSANQSTNFVRPIEFVVLGLKALGTIAAPTVNFSGSPTNGTAPLTVTFTDTSTGSITNRFWDFGDGTTSNTTSTSVQYTYNAGGTKTVRLIESGLGGSSTNTKISYIVVSSGGPSPVVLSVTPSCGTTDGGTAVTISGSNFVSGATVTFGGNAATSVGFVSGTTLTANTPAGTAGDKDVAVINPSTQSGTLTSGFTYVTPVSFAGLDSATAAQEAATLTWSAATGTGVTYNVYEATASGAENFASPVTNTSALTAFITGLDPGSNSPITYYFVVRAADSCGYMDTNTLEQSVQPLLDPVKDQDSDGLPNGFEQAYGFGPFSAGDAANDADGDGLSNLQEFLAGSDPTNSASFFGITSIAQESDDIRVIWMTGPDKTNALERTEGVNGGFSNNFATIFTVTNTVGTVTNYLDLGAATNRPSLYYRVRLVP